MIQNRIRLIKNRNAILKLNNAKDIHTYLDSLSERDRDKLFSYTYQYEIERHRRIGRPVTEYFLLHYDEFIPNELKATFDKAENTLANIYAIAIVVSLFFALSIV